MSITARTALRAGGSLRTRTTNGAAVVTSTPRRRLRGWGVAVLFVAWTIALTLASPTALGHGRLWPICTVAAIGWLTAVATAVIQSRRDPRPDPAVTADVDRWYSAHGL